MDFREVERERKRRAVEATNNVNLYREQLAKLKANTSSRNYFDKNRKLFVKADTEFDQEGFDRRIKSYSVHKARTVERIKREGEAKINYPFAPKLNEQTLELTKNKLPFAEKVERMLEQVHAANEKTKQKRKDQSRAQTPNGTKRHLFPSTFSSKMKDDERADRVRHFYLDNIHWKRRVDQQILANQITQNLMSSSISSQNQNLNGNRSKMNGKSSFTQIGLTPNRAHDAKKIDPPHEFYNRSFTPELSKHE